MCGIIFAESFVNKPVNKVILHQYEQQKNRGMQGFGLFDLDFNNLVRSTTEGRIKRWLKRYPSSSILFHHRFPTSTENVKNACHPFSTKDYFDTNYILVHNGWISNAYALAEEHYEMGIEYHSEQDDGTFNDSEALLWDVALYLEGKQDHLKAKGPIAFICIAIPKDGRKSKKLYFGRNSNPLNLLVDEKDEFIFLSSEGEGEPITANHLYSYNYRSRKLTDTFLLIPEQFTVANNYSSDWRNNWERDEDDWDKSWYNNARINGTDNIPVIDLNDDGSYWVDEAIAPAYTYSVLPDTEKYSYKSIMEGGTDFSFTTAGGTFINVSSEIRRRVRIYLSEAFGLYELAAELADKDYDSTDGQIADDKRNGFVEDEDLILERDYVTAAMEVLFTSPYWIGRDAVDPSYELMLDDEDTKQSIKQQLLLKT